MAHLIEPVGPSELGDLMTGVELVKMVEVDLHSLRHEGFSTKIFKMVHYILEEG